MAWIDDIITFFNVPSSQKKTTFTSKELCNFIAKEGLHKKHNSTKFERTVNRTLQNHSIDSTHSKDSLPKYFSKPDTKGGSWKVVYTTEKEMVEILRKLEPEIHQGRFTRQELNSNEKFKSYLKPADFFIGSSRGKEAWYKQMLGNIVSHRNPNFIFIGYNNISGKDNSINYANEKYFVFKERAENLLTLSSNNIDDVIATQNVISDEDLEKLNSRKIEFYIPNQATSQRAKREPKVMWASKERINHCELGCNMDLLSFINEKNKYYTEGHHVIPMEWQSNFSINLDTTENIIILCANCHRKAHHANKEVKKNLLNKFYDVKKPFMSKVQIHKPSDLMEFY